MALSYVRKYLRRVLADDESSTTHASGGGGTDLEFGTEDATAVLLEPLNHPERLAWETVVLPELPGALANGESYTDLVARLGASEHCRLPAIVLTQGNTYLVDATLHHRLGRAYVPTGPTDEVGHEFVMRAQRTQLIESPPDAADQLVTGGIARAHWRVVTRAGSPMADRMHQVFAAAGLAADDVYGDALDIYPIPAALVGFLCGPTAGMAPEDWRSLSLWAYIAAGKN